MSKPITDLIHHPYSPPAGFCAPQPGVFKASTVIFPDVAAMRARDWKQKAGYTYGLHGTPTTFTLEARIAALSEMEAAQRDRLRDLLTEQLAQLDAQRPVAPTDGAE